MTQAPALLSQILVRIRDSQSRAGRSLVVFDLDSTLFDVSPRTQQIMHDFAAEAEWRDRYPQTVEILKQLQIHSTDWGIKTALIRHGLHTHPVDFHQAVRQYWIDRFFTGDYLHCDRPLPGAVAFVQQVESTGARVVYLTGRDLGSMYEASKMVLQSHGFPEAELVLKPEKGSDDALFKVDWFGEQKLETYDPIYFFENEPLNIEPISHRHPRVQIVFVESTHSGKGEASDNWPRIRNFTI